MADTYKTREERRLAEQAKKRNKRKRPRSFFKKLFIVFLLLSFFSAVAVASTGYAFIKDVPEINPEQLQDPLSSKFFDKDGTFLHEYGKEQRTKITYDQIPKVLEHAIIATEDSRFYTHQGIDVKRTAKAIMANITGGFGSQGGSTITQQVIKNSFLSPEKTVKRKVQEWYLAYELEQQYTKHEILAMYVNKINLGNRSYGVAAAAKNYYGMEVKDLGKLTLPQAAMIAGLTQSPNNYDPTKKENIESATKRRNIVLTLMNMHGYISKKEMADAKKVPVTQGLVQEKDQNGMPYQAFLDAAVREVESKLKNVDISEDGLQIHLTLDPKAQQLADSIMSGRLVSYPNDRFQTAFTFMDSKTGEIRAIGSGRNEYKTTFRGHNLVTTLKRQPGSTFKPIFDYGPAIEYLKWSTYHQIVDAPYKYSTGDPIRNAYKNYRGKMSIRDALVESRNIPALKTLESVGLKKAKTFSEGLGIHYPGGNVYESYSIGSNSVSPLELAGAYGAFANKGIYTEPHFVSKVVMPDGKVIDFTPKSKRVMQDYTAYMVTDMLRGVINADNGTGKMAAVAGADIAGKTGTTNFDENVIRKFGYPEDGTSDSWFSGYSTRYTMTVWTGYAKNGPGNYMNKADTKISHTIFKTMMQNYAGSERFAQPASVEKIRNELYIKGVKRDMVPPAPKPKAKPKKGVSKKKESKHKASAAKGKKPAKTKSKGKAKGKKKD
ncbi:transglycosylase domain-containing protein [Peribacillus deserti]|uniref:Penicillin-binding protein n=1 Tax=Peribacillus deserti TaxID=673318 RepID=A0A2N5M9T2_9BACI|nr:PBP1A family penicillin-binding protein [Peribacillus deserti]PLT31114.1 penicillin-binding protein [Peribacillus deserti]